MRKLRKHSQIIHKKQGMKVFTLNPNGLLRFKGRVYVPNSKELRNLVLKDVHNAPYFGHLCVTKMLAYVKPLYFWKGMKGDVARCLECQIVKEEHHHPVGLLYLHDIPKSKWQVISIDFVQGIPMSRNKHNVILVVVDKLTTVAHFILRNITDGAPIIAHKFIQEVFISHGIHEKIILDRNARVTSRFWQTLFSSLGTKLNISLAYHLETNGKIERVNQVLEDILRMYYMYQQYKWEENLPLVEFAYNNSYHSAIKMAPFEAFYGRK